MHSVSPVRIRIQNHVKNPMIATNFQDLPLNSSKTKKKVKIGASTILNLSTNKKPQIKKTKKSSQSLSPKSLNRTSVNWCPPQTRKSNKTLKKTNKIDLMKTCRLSDYDYDLKSIRESRKKMENNSLPPCEICIEARSRSRSKTPDRTISDELSSFYDHKQNLNENNNNNISLTSKRTSSSLSPVSLNRSSNQSIDPNCTFTIQPRSRSHESFLNNNDCNYGKNGFISNIYENDLLTKRELMIKKLNDSETFANEIAVKLNQLKEFLIYELNNSNLILDSPDLILKRFELDRNDLIQLIDLFDLTNRDLKNIFNDLTSSKTLNEIRHIEDFDYLIYKAKNLEIENNNFRKILLEYEKNVSRTGSTNEALNIENSALASLKQSLEDNRAHLRRQLIARESDINRLNVQIRNLNRKLDRSQMEIELLRENREKAGLSSLNFNTATNQSLLNKNQMNNSNKQSSTNLSNNLKNIKLNKNHFTLEEILNDPIKTRFYIEKLNTKLKEKDLIINNFESSKSLKTNLEQQLPTQNENLTVQIKEIQSNRKLNEKSENSKSSSSLSRSDKLEMEKLRKENEKLKLANQVKDEKLKKFELKLKKNNNNSINDQKRSNSVTNSANIKNKRVEKSINTESETINLNTHTHNTSSDENTSNLHTHSSPRKSINEKNLDTTSQQSSQQQIQRNKNFSEIELNNVRSRLQQRLNELEPLPEMLKNTELKLHDALTKLKNYEQELNENRKIINNLKTQLEHSNSKLNKNIENKLLSIDLQKNSLFTNSSANLIQNDLNNINNNNTKMSKTERHEIERRIQNIEEENRELIRQLGQKDDLIRDITNKLSIKSNEAASFNRQLDLALSDSNVREQQMKEKFLTKERSLQTKLADLESKLRSLELHSTVDRRDKDEMAQDYLTQIRDLKAKLEQTQSTNKQMQEYVNFLKNSYISYFNDNTLSNFEMASSGICSSNYLSGSNGFF